METINVSAHLPSSGFAICITGSLFFLCRYNKRDVDFSSLRDYNDYLEQVEDIGWFRQYISLHFSLKQKAHMHGNTSTGRSQLYMWPRVMYIWHTMCSPPRLNR